MVKKKNKHRSLKKLVLKKFKYFSPLIAIILLIIFSVIITYVLINWGSEFTIKNLKNFDVDLKEDTSLIGFVYPYNPTQDNFILKNSSKKSLEFTHYKIISENSSQYSEVLLPFESQININSGGQVKIPILCSPSSSYQVSLITKDGTYITVPINNVDYELNSCNDSELPNLVCLGVNENGSGNDSSDPLVICSVDDLNNVRNELNKYYKLGRSIDLNVVPYNENEGWLPIGDDSLGFTGSFDGNGYTISNLYINRPLENYIGLFGYTDYANINNLQLENTSIIGQNYVGSLIGYNLGGKISTTNSIGQVYGVDFVGGLIGENNISGMIEYSFANSDVNGYNFVGGLIGSNSYGDIKNSYSLGTVNGLDFVGGLVGENYGDVQIPSEIINSYSAINVLSVGETHGGFIGGHGGDLFHTAFCIYSLNFWDQNVSNPDLYSVGNKGDLENITRSNSIDMKNQNTFIGWDFDNVWQIQEGITYPYLMPNPKSVLPKSK